MISNRPTRPQHRRVSNISAEVIKYDIKPLIRTAFDRKKADEYCEKSNLMAQRVNSKFKRIRGELEEKINTRDMLSFVNELLHSNTYVHSLTHKILGNLLIGCRNTANMLRRNVS